MSVRLVQDDLCDQPLKVVAYEAAVVLLGPDAVHLAMTAEAAKTSARLLIEAAGQAEANS